jgi:hypothetical protein
VQERASAQSVLAAFTASRGHQSQPHADQAATVRLSGPTVRRVQAGTTVKKRHTILSFVRKVRSARLEAQVNLPVQPAITVSWERQSLNHVSEALTARRALQLALYVLLATTVLRDLQRKLSAMADTSALKAHRSAKFVPLRFIVPKDRRRLYSASPGRTVPKATVCVLRAQKVTSALFLRHSRVSAKQGPTVLPEQASVVHAPLDHTALRALTCRSFAHKGVTVKAVKVRAESAQQGTFASRSRPLL